MSSTILDRIEVETQTGNIFVRLKKEGGARDGWHRTVIAPNVAAADQMAAVNMHIGSMGYPAVTPADMAKIVAVMALIAQVRAAKAAEIAEVERLAVEQAGLERQDAEARKSQQAAANKAVFDAAVKASVEAALAEKSAAK